MIYVNKTLNERAAKEQKAHEETLDVRLKQLADQAETTTTDLADHDTPIDPEVIRQSLKIFETNSEDEKDKDFSPVLEWAQ